MLSDSKRLWDIPDWIKNNAGKKKKITGKKDVPVNPPTGKEPDQEPEIIDPVTPESEVVDPVVPESEVIEPVTPEPEITEPKPTKEPKSKPAGKKGK